MKINHVNSDLPECNECKNPLRRRLCKDDFFKFCETYCGDSNYSEGAFENCFYRPVDFHKEMCLDLQQLVLAPGHKRMGRAAPRGCGKTTLSVLVNLWAILYGHKKCSVWFCENESKAKERADMMQGQLMRNKLLAEDFPEMCASLKVEGQTDWVSDGKRLPNGAWTLWRSIDGGNLGTLLDFMRPDFIAIDDPENCSTIRKTGANTQSITAQKRFDRIDKEICYLPERGKGSLLIVTTIRSRGCLSDLYTDPEMSPAWEGKVYSAIDFGETTDENKDFIKTRDGMWNKYLALCGSKDVGPEPDDSELMLEQYTPELLNIDRAKYESFAPRLKKALRYFANNEARMRAGIVELDPVRIPVWDFHWQIGSDSRGKEIVWSELQNTPLDDPFTKQMRFTEKKLWTHKTEVLRSIIPSGFNRILCAVVVGTDFINWEMKACDESFTLKHLVECGTIMPDYHLPKDESIRVELDKLRALWSKHNPLFVAVDIGTEAGRDRGEWSEIVARYCAKNRPWLALQKCMEWDSHQSARAGFKNFCAELESNPYGIVRWNATHYKNRLASAYNNPSHPITFFDPGKEQDLWNYIRSQTSEQYTLEFIPDKDASKANVEKWSPVPKYRNMTEFWKTASMIECLADIASVCKPRPRSAPKPIAKYVEKLRRI